MRNWLISTEAKQAEYYRGRLIRADTGVHEQAIALFRKHVPSGQAVLDLGAGAGAFSMRLADSGYAVTAVDIDPDDFGVEDIPFVRLDIDKGLAGSLDTTFDAVCCLEVIEHVEDQWNLLREAHALLRPGGILLLSTPNVTSFYSRLRFLRTGRFHQFDEGDFSYGHINPVTAFHLSQKAGATGWKLRETQPGGYLPVFDLSSLNTRRVLANIVRGLTYFVSGGEEKRGWCLFFVLEKTDDVASA